MRVAIVKKGEAKKYERWLKSGKNGYKRLPSSLAKVRDRLKKYEGVELPIIRISAGLVHVRLPSGEEWSIHRKVFTIKLK